MLQCVYMYNLARFKEVQKITVADPDADIQGENQMAIFVGENHSGKSAATEAVRRCCAGDISISHTNLYDDAKIGYALAKFALKDLPCIHVSDSDNLQVQYCHSFYIRKKTTRSAYKCLVLTDTENKHHLVGYQEIEDKSPKRYFAISDVVFTKCLTSFTDMENLLSNLKKDPETSMNDLADNLFGKVADNLFGKVTDDHLVAREVCEKIYHILLSNSVVFLFGLRGIGPVDSSLSSKMSNGDLNYDEADERAETFQLLYDRAVDREGGIEKFDDTLCDIVGQKDIKFRKVGTKIQFVAGGDTIRLLKAPEGIFEAAQIVLIVNEPSIKTAFLEEPNRLMHPDMIDRLRIKLTEVSKEKSIVVVSHSPYLLTWQNRCSLHVFRRRNDPQHVDRELHELKRPFDDPRAHAELEGMLFSYWKEIFFSRRALFVEGRSDKMLISSIISIMQEKSSDAAELSAFNIFRSEGKCNLWRLVEICRCAGIDWCVIADADILYEQNTMDTVFTKRLKNEAFGNKEVKIWTVGKSLNKVLPKTLSDNRKDTETTIGASSEKQSRHDNFLAQIKDKKCADSIERIKKGCTTDEQTQNQQAIMEILNGDDNFVYKTLTQPLWRPIKWAKDHPNLKLCAGSGMNNLLQPCLEPLLHKMAGEQEDYTEDEFSITCDSHKRLLTEAERSGVFMWEAGSLEAVINSHYFENREDVKTKSELGKFSEKQFRELAREMYDHSTSSATEVQGYSTKGEIKRLVDFLLLFAARGHSDLG